MGPGLDSCIRLCLYGMLSAPHIAGTPVFDAQEQGVEGEYTDLPNLALTALSASKCAGVWSKQMRKTKNNVHSASMMRTQPTLQLLFVDAGHTLQVT